MTDITPELLIYCALPCEAKPLIARFKLTKQAQHRSFSIYQNPHIALIVSGVGKQHMSAAVGYSLGLWPHISDAVMLNIGIAGHSSHPVGTLFYAHKISDADNSSLSFYPQRVFNNNLPGSAITSISMPADTYLENCLMDMEASAFYEIAIKASSIELIHCLKIVSDNSANPATQITAKMVSRLINDNLQALDDFIKHLLSLKHAITAPAHTEQAKLLQQYHFTVSNQVKLKNLLQRWQVLTENAPLPLGAYQAINAKAFLQYLESELEKLDYSL